MLFSFAKNLSLSYRQILKLQANKYISLKHNNFYTAAIFFKQKETKPVIGAPKTKVIDVWNSITIEELAQNMDKPVSHVFEVLKFIGFAKDYPSKSCKLQEPTIVYEIIKKSGFKYKIVPPPNKSIKETENQDVKPRPPPDPSLLKPRPPVVTIMGHVDHGKTTLLDTLRHTSVVSGEFGGITQHIGAFSVKLEKTGETIIFLDTPGHAAFSSMRARGANVTDIVVLVVAADDGVMEQTIESIKMAKEAQVPIIVAINKIDKPNVDVARTKKMLIPYGIQVEDEGGEVQAIEISALKGTNLDQLIEAIILQAQIMDLKSDPTGLVEGVVIESKIDPRRGKLSTSIVNRGTLRKGDILVSGIAWARVRAMFNHANEPIIEAPPSYPVEILGWKELPSPGDIILEVENEKKAHRVIHYRLSQKMIEKQQQDLDVIKEKMAQHEAVYKEKLELKRKLGRFRLKPTGPRQKEIVDGSLRINVIIKGDVDGSVEAILDILETYDCNDICKLNLVHYGVGQVCENDLELAEIFSATIYAFNIDCTNDKIKEMLKEKSIKFKPINVIYRLVDDLKEEINKLLPTKKEEKIIGTANVLQEFIIQDGKKKIPIAGCRCVSGNLKKSELFKLVRNNEVIYKGILSSMRHLKNEVDTIKKDVECGLQFKNVVKGDLEFKSGDTIVCYQEIDVPQTIQWDPGF